ncbi:DUF4974 domain-containing protein [Fulvivirga sp. M361]|uniref:FecR family protein n=1 Tax=Fulvivirga sp. M361 TaxID=2594266 RepID=UPI00117AF641|nr:FecR family protein [Fulvivirga sp. M361]TRX49691.1 DUF4974 domain-containing protein [Fulvivirga sp. M361]
MDRALSKYNSFNQWDFLDDPYFVRWVIYPDTHSDKFWKQFLDNHPGKLTEVSLAREFILDMKYKNELSITDLEYNTLFERLLTRQESKSSNRFFPSHFLRRGYRYAAAVCLLAISGWLVFQYQTHRSDALRSGNVTAKMITKTSSMGQKLTTVLGDGTSVKLNAGSSISYPNIFADSIRRVVLVGEAFFEVKKDTLRPFQVQSGDVIVQVLGTSFNVKGFAQEKTVSVAVEEGKVRVTAFPGATANFEHILTDYQISIYDVERKYAEKKDMESTNAFAWKDGRLVFDNERLDKILKRMERWYNVSFEVNKTVELTQSYSGAFQNEPLEVVLKGLRHQGAFDYQIEDKIILIQSL